MPIPIEEPEQTENYVSFLVNASEDVFPIVIFVSIKTLTTYCESFGLKSPKKNAQPQAQTITIYALAALSTIFFFTLIISNMYPPPTLPKSYIGAL